MKVGAQVQSSRGQHHVTLRTGDHVQSLAILPKPTGFGSSASGGELLFLALATCYCNDVYREAAKHGLSVEQVVVVVEGDFGAEGEPAKNMTYRVRVVTGASEAEVRDLLRHTDLVAEVQNTLRLETPVTLNSVEIVNG